MASLKEIAREYRDEIMDGIAWVAIWKTGRSWNAKAFWLNLETERIEDEEMEEAREIVAADPKAIFINEYYTAHMGEGKLDEIVEGIRFMYENEYNLLANNTAYAEEEQEGIQESDGGTGQERKTKGRKRMRKKYYHAATPETMEKIIADGVVKRGWDGCVYLCEKPQDAAKFVAIRGHDEVAAIEVILPANKVKESFDHSVQFFQCKAFMYEEDIKVRPNAEVVEYSFK